eukprot:896538-Prorocentrum_lima.AAC.1
MADEMQADIRTFKVKKGIFMAVPVKKFGLDWAIEQYGEKHSEVRLPGKVVTVNRSGDGARCYFPDDKLTYPFT